MLVMLDPQQGLVATSLLLANERTTTGGCSLTCTTRNFVFIFGIILSFASKSVAATRPCYGASITSIAIKELLLNGHSSIMLLLDCLYCWLLRELLAVSLILANKRFIPPIMLLLACIAGSLTVTSTGPIRALACTRK